MFSSHSHVFSTRFCASGSQWRTWLGFSCCSEKLYHRSLILCKEPSGLCKNCHILFVLFVYLGFLVLLDQILLKKYSHVTYIKPYLYICTHIKTQTYALFLSKGGHLRE